MYTTLEMFLCPAVAERVIKFSLVHQSVLSIINLKQPNVMKLIHNAYYHNTKINFQFW